MAIVKIVPQLGCVSQDSEALISVPWKPGAESLGIISKCTIHSVYATSREYPGQERTNAWTYTSQKSPSAKSLRFENLRTGPMKRLKDNSDVLKARFGTLPKPHTSSKKKTKLHSTRPRKNGYSWLRQQRAGGKRVLWWIPELVCIWSAGKRP